MAGTNGRTLTMSDLAGLTTVMEAAQRNAHVKRLINDDVVVDGTARNVCSEDGGFYPRDADVRDAFLRVTLHGVGSEALWPVAELVEQAKAYTFVIAA
jgi:hypothetical protein